MRQLIIRPADFDRDALAIIEGAKDFAQRVSFRSVFRTGEDFIKDISRIVTLPGLNILLAESRECIVGGIGILFVPYVWNPTRLAAEELFFWTSVNAPFKTARLLCDTAMNKIEELKAIPMFRRLHNSPKGITKLYEKRYKLWELETVYTRLPWL